MYLLNHDNFWNVKLCIMILMNHKILWNTHMIRTILSIHYAEGSECNIPSVYTIHKILKVHNSECHIRDYNLDKIVWQECMTYTLVKTICIDIMVDIDPYIIYTICVWHTILSRQFVSILYMYSHIYTFIYAFIRTYIHTYIYIYI